MAVCGVGTVWLLAPSEADRLREQKEQLVRERAELQKAIERLTAQTRVAEVFVLDQTPPTTGPVITTLQVVELDRQGRPLPARSFTVPGEVIYFDFLTIKFDAQKVAAGDALRGKSIALFRRLYGEQQSPAEGYLIDPAGDVPNIFRLDAQPSDVERRLWSKFWDYVDQPALAAQEGVRVAQGEAIYVRMRKDQQWSLTLDHNGGMNIKLSRPVAEPLDNRTSPGLQ